MYELYGQTHFGLHSNFHTSLFIRWCPANVRFYFVRKLDSDGYLCTSPNVDFMEKFLYSAKKRWQYSALKGEECNRRIHYLISVFSPWQKDFPGQECHPKKTRTHKKGITLLSNHLCDVGVSTYLPSKSLGITLKWETPIRFFAGWFSKVRIAILENVLWYGMLLTYIMYWLNPLGKW